MQRLFIGAVAALLVCAGSAFAADKDTVSGPVKKIDADKGVITVTVGKKNDKTDKEFTITDKTKFVIGEGEEKKEMTGKDGLKEVKEGGTVLLVTEDGKLTSVTVMMKKKK